MERHFEKAISDLLEQATQMGSEVEKALESCRQSLIQRDAQLAEGAFRAEKAIDAFELSLDDAILDFIALHQPVAVDLRFAMSLQDAVVDLERIGDHCTNIAESGVTLAGLRVPPDLLMIPEMLNHAKQMLHDSIISFVTRNTETARKVIQSDDRMDELNRELIRSVIKAVKEDRQLVETGIELIRVSRNLERIGDLSTNIAEDAVFLVEARSARHVQPKTP